MTELKDYLKVYNLLDDYENHYRREKEPNDDKPRKELLKRQTSHILKLPDSSLEYVEEVEEAPPVKKVVVAEEEESPKKKPKKKKKKSKSNSKSKSSKKASERSHHTGSTVGGDIPVH